MFECFDITYWNVFISHISRYFMSSIRTFRDILCRQFEHFAIQSVDEIISTLFKHQKRINALNRRFLVRRIRSSKNTISLKKMSKEKSLIRSSQYRKNEMIMISQIMYRYRKRCYEFLCDEQFEFFASNRIRELSLFFSFRSTAWNENTSDARRRLCESSLISNYSSLFCAINMLNFRCDLFISST
jgi:hypothetical protein